MQRLTSFNSQSSTYLCIPFDCIKREVDEGVLQLILFLFVLMKELEDLLPSRPDVPNIIGDTEEVELQEFDSTRGSGGGQRREAYNDSSDEESSSHHGPGVQCAHQ